MNNLFDFDNKYIISRWAKAEEFRGDGKQIKPLKWEVLIKGEGNPPAHYVNNKNYSYRLTFEDGEGNVRIYENRWDSFMISIKNSGIKPNVWGVLKNFQDEKGHWQWEWKPL